MKKFLLSLVLVVLAVTPVFAEQVLVAVAANFIGPFREVATEFEQATGHNVQIAAGSSGNFYAQIKNGAPFDVFFSADNERPKLLEDEGLGVKGSRFTYAIGRLVLWSLDPDLVKREDTLRSANFKRLAIANPKTAPYGVAAMQAMQKLGVWENAQPRIVMGESLGQTMDSSSPAMLNWALLPCHRSWIQRSRVLGAAGMCRSICMIRSSRTSSCWRRERTIQRRKR